MRLSRTYFPLNRHIYYIYNTISMFHTATNAYWLRVNHTSDLPGFKPQTRKECLQDPLTRKECLHTRAKGERGEEKRERVREQQRLGMSQGTMIREPKYGGGAHPKYRSCRGLVSLIPRTCTSGCPHEILVVRRGRSLKVVRILIPSHGLFHLVSVE